MISKNKESNVGLLRLLVTYIGDGYHGVNMLCRWLGRQGIERSVHEGKPEEFFEDNPERIAEWLLGQFIDIVKSNQWLAMNTFVNYSKDFLEKQNK